jgi:hypothetical protein
MRYRAVGLACMGLLFMPALQTFGEPIKVSQSKPVRVKGVEFVAVVQTNWTPISSGVDNIAMQLRITNATDKDIILPTFRAFGIKISDADGKEIKPRSVKQDDIPTRAILLPPGASHALTPRVELRAGENSQASELVYYDGTGSQSVIGPLPRGRYKLVFWYSVAASGNEAEHKIGDLAMWYGELVTHQITVEIAGTPVRGHAAEPDKDVSDSTEALRIHGSKPVSVNDAKFVAVSQAEWKPGMKNEITPLEISLCITNASKVDLLFQTSGTISLVLKNPDGTRVKSTGGRDWTRFTRPVLIPGGATFSLAREGSPIFRRAELRRDATTKIVSLIYWDGTGSWAVYGPLEPGRYSLSFRFAVFSNNPLGIREEAGSIGYWTGVATTEEVSIVFRNP